MNPPFVHRLLLTLVPAFLIGGVVLTAIWGDNGLVRRAELQTELRTANDDLRAIQKQNQRLLHHLRLMEQDPIVIERAVADELEVAPTGSTIYRFDAEPSGPNVPLTAP
ncbi:MAG: cell division protein FtsB [Kiritimatiellia bacterium]